MIENDTFLRDASKDSTLKLDYRAPSIILASGGSQGSSATNVIESIDSTILGGAMDSDLSFYSPNETMRTINYTAQSLLNKRLPSDDDEFIDCETSFDDLTSQSSFANSTSSTKFKTLSNVFPPNARSENNNTIFKPIIETPTTSIFKNTESYEPSTSNQNVDFPRQIHHLTTILEESNSVSHSNSKRISGIKLLSVVEDLKKGPLSYLPENQKFNETVKNFADILNRSLKDITVDQLAYILLYTLKTNFNYTDGESDSDSLLSFKNLTTTTEMNVDTSGKELDSIVKELRDMYLNDKKIENESSPDWPLSAKSSTHNSGKKSVLFCRTNQEAKTLNKKKEYFPFSLSNGCKNNKENINFEKSSQEKINDSPVKKKVCFATKIQTPLNSKRCLSKTMNKKYTTTPHLKNTKRISRRGEINVTTGSEDSFNILERMCNENDEETRLRRSISLIDIASDESLGDSGVNCERDNQIVQRILRDDRVEIQEPIKKYRKRRSKSLERDNCYPVYGNDDIPKRNVNLPSTSGILKKVSSIRKETVDSIPKIIVTSDNGSVCESPNYRRNQLKTDSSNFLSRPSIKNRRKSSGIDNSHIPCVSQLRKIFSPADKRRGENFHFLF